MAKVSNSIILSFLFSLLISTLILVIILTSFYFEGIKPINEKVSYLTELTKNLEDYQELCTKTETITERELIETKINLNCQVRNLDKLYGCAENFKQSNFKDSNNYNGCIEFRGGEYGNWNLAIKFDCLDLAHYENITRTYCLEKSLIKKVWEEIR